MMLTPPFRKNKLHVKHNPLYLRKPNNPQVPWRKIIAHEYGEILVERIWLTATIHIPELLDNINLIAEV